jgi:hypothetical protein
MQRRDVARRRLHEHVLVGRHQVASGGDERPAEPSTPVSFVDLEGCLPPAGESPTEHEHAFFAARREGPHVGAVALGSFDAGVRRSRVERRQLEARFAAPTGRREDDVEAARRGRDQLGQFVQKARAHRSQEVAYRQPRAHPRRVDVGGDHVMPREGQHCVDRARRRRKHVDVAVERRGDPACRPCDEIDQRMKRCHRDIFAGLGTLDACNRAPENPSPISDANELVSLRVWETRVWKTRVWETRVWETNERGRPMAKVDPSSESSEADAGALVFQTAEGRYFRLPSDRLGEFAMADADVEAFLREQAAQQQQQAPSVMLVPVPYPVPGAMADTSGLMMRGMPMMMPMMGAMGRATPMMGMMPMPMGSSLTRQHPPDVMGMAMMPGAMQRATPMMMPMMGAMQRATPMMMRMPMAMGSSLTRQHPPDVMGMAMMPGAMQRATPMMGAMQRATPTMMMTPMMRMPMAMGSSLTRQHPPDVMGMAMMPGAMQRATPMMGAMQRATPMMGAMQRATPMMGPTIMRSWMAS